VRSLKTFIHASGSEHASAPKGGGGSVGERIFSESDPSGPLIALEAGTVRSTVSETILALAEAGKAPRMTIGHRLTTRGN